MGLTEGDIDAADNFEEDSRFSERERWALRFAKQLKLDPSRIRADFYAGMKKYFTDAEIMELGVFVAINLGFHAFFSTLEFTPYFDHHVGPGGRRVEDPHASVSR
jgi:alkylhydroperoxidase family enzyme